MKAFLNGQLIDAADAFVSARDSGFTHAVGLFETMAAFNGRVFRLDDHLDRLRQSALTLGLVRDLDTQTLADCVQQTVDAAGAGELRVRLTITAGPAPYPPGDAPAAPPQPTVFIEPTEPIVYDPRFFEEGITVLLTPPMANPFDPMAGHKTLNYWSRLRTLRQAASAGAGEAIWLNISNHLASGAVSNVFLVKDGELFTPIARGEETDGALAAPVLPGITRGAVIDIAEARDIKVHRRMLSVEQLLEADEVFLTNSGWQVLPVSRIEQRVIGGGKAGDLTQSLRAAQLQTIERETQGDNGV